MADSQRFRAPSDNLDLQRLWRETVKYTARGLIVGFVAVTGALLYLVLRVEERAAPPPAVARLIIRKPRSTKSFTLKRQRLRPRALTKQVTALTPRLSLPSARRLAGPSVFGTVQTFDYAPDTDVQINLQSTPIELSRRHHPRHQGAGQAHRHARGADRPERPRHGEVQGPHHPGPHRPAQRQGLRLPGHGLGQRPGADLRQRRPGDSEPRGRPQHPDGDHRQGRRPPLPRLPGGSSAPPSCTSRPGRPSS